MMAQVYYYDAEPIIRVFSSSVEGGGYIICDIPLNKWETINDKVITKKLRDVRMRKRTSWKETSWGTEAKVRYI